MAAITRYCEVCGQLLFFPFNKSKREDEGGGNGGCHSKMDRDSRFSESGRVNAEWEDALGRFRREKIWKVV